MPIEVAFDGRAGGPQLVRTSAKGTKWMSISIAVNIGEEKPEWVSVACFGDVMESLPTDLMRGERVYVEGKLRVNRFTDKSGTDRATLQVNATRALVLDRIGRKARRVKRSKGRSDQLPERANGEMTAATPASGGLIPF